MAGMNGVSGGSAAGAYGPLPYEGWPGAQQLKDGQWCWVRLSDALGAIETPARYMASVDCWYSHQFTGVPTRHLTVLAAIPAPGAELKRDTQSVALPGPTCMDAEVDDGATPKPSALANDGRGDVPDGVWEALQRMIEDGMQRGPGGRDDALAVARHRYVLMHAGVRADAIAERKQWAKLAGTPSCDVCGYAQGHCPCTIRAVARQQTCAPLSVLCPPGWVPMPGVATEAMVQAGIRAAAIEQENSAYRTGAPQCYTAMVAARPSPPVCLALADVSCYAVQAPGQANGEVINVEMVRPKSGPALWAIRMSGECMNKQGEWVTEPSPSHRDAEFVASFRFHSAGEALSVLRKALGIDCTCSTGGAHAGVR